MVNNFNILNYRLLRSFFLISYLTKCYDTIHETIQYATRYPHSYESFYVLWVLCKEKYECKLFLVIDLIKSGIHHK